MLPIYTPIVRAAQLVWSSTRGTLQGRGHRVYLRGWATLAAARGKVFALGHHHVHLTCAVRLLFVAFGRVG